LASQRQIYTTKQAADVLGVSLPTVVNWIKQGLIEAHKTPGGHRRIARASLSSFMIKNGYPSSGMGAVNLALNNQILILTKEPDLGDLVTDWLELKLKVKTTVAASLFLSGVAIGEHAPSVFIIDTTTVQIQLSDTLRKLGSIESCKDTEVILVSGPRGIHEPPPNTTVLRQPLNLEQLRVTVEEILSIRNSNLA
jgi:excisionase family DNA binding protein